ncbi:hypothetical protein EYF80_037103 [Liparis tanakae]|uniref:Uncharacterized protein n=1 Tax=Liparis tanakae TaxID=230148 RepID=A0A4Z2GIN4_9TELE|nr:hypothetical protein EYF80_037103 [Liparis tanakae]
MEGETEKPERLVGNMESRSKKADCSRSLFRLYLVWYDDCRAATDAHDGQRGLSGEEVQDLSHFGHLEAKQTDKPPKCRNPVHLSVGPGAHVVLEHHAVELLHRHGVAEARQQVPGVGVVDQHGHGADHDGQVHKVFPAETTFDLILVAGAAEHHGHVDGGVEEERPGLQRERRGGEEEEKEEQEERRPGRGRRMSPGNGHAPCQSDEERSEKGGRKSDEMPLQRRSTNTGNTSAAAAVTPPRHLLLSPPLHLLCLLHPLPARGQEARQIHGKLQNLTGR